MTLRAAAVLAAVALLLALLLGGCSTDDVKAPKVVRLPDVTLSSLDGGPSLDLSTLRGPAVINLWASWCAPCRDELPLYEAFAQEYAGKVDVIGIDFQETRPAAARRLARDTGVTYPLYSDPDGELRAVGLPKVILLDAEGRIAHEKYVEITAVDQLEDLARTHLGVDR